MAKPPSLLEFTRGILTITLERLGGTIWTGKPQPHLAAKVGIAAKELDAQQQSKLMVILNAFTSHMPAEVIKQRMDLIKTAGIDQIYVRFCG